MPKREKLLGTILIVEWFLIGHWQVKDFVVEKLM